MKLTEKNGVSDLTWVGADGDPNGDEAAAALASGRTSFADLRRQKARDQVGLHSPDLQYWNNDMAKVTGEKLNSSAKRNRPNQTFSLYKDTLWSDLVWLIAAPR